MATAPGCQRQRQEPEKEQRVKKDPAPLISRELTELSGIGNGRVMEKIRRVRDDPRDLAGLPERRGVRVEQASGGAGPDRGETRQHRVALGHFPGHAVLQDEDGPAVSQEPRPGGGDGFEHPVDASDHLLGRPRGLRVGPGLGPGLAQPRQLLERVFGCRGLPREPIDVSDQLGARGLPPERQSVERRGRRISFGDPTGLLGLGHDGCGDLGQPLLDCLGGRTRGQDRLELAEEPPGFLSLPGNLGDRDGRWRRNGRGRPLSRLRRGLRGGRRARQRRGDAPGARQGEEEEGEDRRRAHHGSRARCYFAGLSSETASACV